jgi:hypothetical protein
MTWSALLPESKVEVQVGRKGVMVHKGQEEMCCAGMAFVIVL